MELIRAAVTALQGVIVGAGAIIPGVSGGVLCVAFGLYRPFMAMLANPIKGLRENGCLLIPFLIGFAGGFVLLAGAVDALFGADAAIASALFAGLVFGSLPKSLQDGSPEDTRRGWLFFTVTLALAFAALGALDGVTTGPVEPTVTAFLLCGLLWGLAIVAPGFNTSPLFVALGLYQPMAAGVAHLKMGVLLPIIAGAAITVALTARLVDRLYKRRYVETSRAVLGFVIASTLRILPTRFSSPRQALLCMPVFAAGFAVTMAIEYLEILL